MNSLFFPYWIDIQIPFNSPAGCLAGGRPPLLMRALSCRGRSHFAPGKSSDQVVVGFIIKNSSAALEKCFHIYALFWWFFLSQQTFFTQSVKKNATKMFQMKGEGFWIMFKETADLVTVGVPNIYLFFTYIMDLFSSKIWNWTRCVGVGRILIWGVVGL